MSSRRDSGNIDFSMRHPVKCFKYTPEYNLSSYQIQPAQRPAVKRKFNLSSAQKPWSDHFTAMHMRFCPRAPEVGAVEAGSAVGDPVVPGTPSQSDQQFLRQLKFFQHPQHHRQ
jgi:hypothetical protein